MKNITFFSLIFDVFIIYLLLRINLATSLLYSVRLDNSTLKTWRPYQGIHLIAFYLNFNDYILIIPFLLNVAISLRQLS